MRVDASRTAGVDVKQTLLIAVVEAEFRGKPIVQVSAEIWLRGAASGQLLRKRPISSKKRSEAGSCSRNKWFRPGNAMNRAPGMPAAN